GGGPDGRRRREGGGHPVVRAGRARGPGPVRSCHRRRRGPEASTGERRRWHRRAPPETRRAAAWNGRFLDAQPAEREAAAAVTRALMRPPTAALIRSIDNSWYDGPRSAPSSKTARKQQLLSKTTTSSFRRAKSAPK